jgi:hypothetical protein
MRKDTLEKVTNKLKEQYPDIGLNSIEVNDKTGQAIFHLQPKKELAFLDKNKSIVNTRMTPQEKAATIRRDAVDRTVLDLAKKDVTTETPEELFKRAIKYYYMDPLVGTTTNLLANLSYKGFENDVDDPNIKNFYDTWTFDVNFPEILEWIFLDFFKVGHVTTYKTLAKYEPRVSYLSPIPGKKGKTSKKTTGKEGEKAAKKNIWSKGHLPVAYTVLNPQLVTIEGSLLFNKFKVSLRPPPELTALLKKDQKDLSAEEKELIKVLPSDLKAAAEKGGEIALDSRLVGSITYRKQPYERYAKPRTTRVFDTIEYKNSLREADLSTLDGISNYILKITIGSDEYPVTTQAELEAVAQLFNTPSKSFDVVWNHTLKIEKIVSPEISSILGQEKYAQVNDDMTTGLAITRSIIDGVGRTSAPEIAMMAKGLMEEINYARRQVTRWIYREYQQIAEAMKFDRFPKIRWDDGVLQDVILYMSTISQLVDRRMMSYRTALEKLGFDYDTELQNMTEEFDIVQDGIFGIIGSPWQQAKVQPFQRAPEGTPSSGRPDGEPAKPKQKETEPNKKLKTKTASMTVAEAAKKMSEKEFAMFINELVKVRVEEDKNSVEEE